jgi:hypothetical protein
MSDELNPNYMFQQTDTELLVGIMSGTINPHLQAARHLANRGLNHKGEWVGFAAAHMIYHDYKKKIPA